MTESLIDIGVNLSNNRFNDDLVETLERALNANVSQLVLTGTSIEESKQVVKLCEQFEQQFPKMLTATVGVHPHKRTLALLVSGLNYQGLKFNQHASCAR